MKQSINKKFSFGFGQCKVVITDSFLQYRRPGAGWCFTDLDDNPAVNYEEHATSAALHIFAGGQKIKTLRVPRRKKSRELAMEIIKVLKEAKK